MNVFEWHYSYCGIRVVVEHNEDHLVGARVDDEGIAIFVGVAVEEETAIFFIDFHSQGNVVGGEDGAGCGVVVAIGMDGARHLVVDETAASLAVVGYTRTAILNGEAIAAIAKLVEEVAGNNTHL